MTGQSEANKRVDSILQPELVDQSFETDEADNEVDERIEIPAFLRRQAN